MNRMMYSFWVLFLLLAGLQVTWQISLPTDATYHAGVVEFAPALEGDAKQKVYSNLRRIKDIIESEEVRDLDILVFPEYVLNSLSWPTYVPDPKDNIAPCDTPNYDYFLTEISCATRSRKLYVVINLIEKVRCDPAAAGCEESGLNKYNTNVVLDRKGRIISRYRKSHLYRYEWYSTNVLPTPELATFTTDFNVTFGHFICFDMLFYNPAQVLVKQLKITDIIYPTYWFSELPFLTAVQLQEGWAIANNVNLLAADASNPSGQNTGSGIYAGKLGRITAIIQETNSTKVLKAQVPKRNMPNAAYQLPLNTIPAPSLETPRFKKLSLLRDYNVDIFNTELLEDNFTSLNSSVCHNSFCCEFEVHRNPISESSAHTAYRYRLAAYQGRDTTHQRIDRSELGICALIACTNDQLYSCGHIFPESVQVGNKYYFNSITIKGAFRTSRSSLLPSTVDGLIMPLPTEMYSWIATERNNLTEVTMTLSSPKADLLTFGIWANYYSTDITTHNLDAIIKSSAVNLQFPINLLLISTLLSLFIRN